LEQLLRHDRVGWRDACGVAVRSCHAQHRLADIPNTGHARASMTPALYSFSGVLLQSMVALVPWRSDWPSGVIFVVMGIGGVIYRIWAIRLRSTLHLRAISGPIDWIFHNMVPLVASVSLTFGGAGLIAGAAFGPFALAGAITLLLVSGIYRTWGQTLALIGIQEKS
jgi:hypothetical protein